MKIGIIGASGQSGHFLVTAALQRNYQTVAIVRNANKSNIEDKNLIVREADLNNIDSVINASKDVDILINAYGPSGNESSLHEKFAHTLIKVVTTNHNIKRLIIIGGGGSLLDKDNNLVFESETFPAEWKEHARMQWKALEAYRNSDINWTYFSPGIWYLPDGKLSHNIIFGKNHLLFNNNQESKISYATVANIIMDEIKNNQYIKSRFHAIEK